MDYPLVDNEIKLSRSYAAALAARHDDDAWKAWNVYGDLLYIDAEMDSIVESIKYNDYRGALYHANAVLKVVLSMSDSWREKLTEQIAWLLNIVEKYRKEEESPMEL